MSELSLEPEEYQRQRNHFRSSAGSLALFREALFEHGFSEEHAIGFCALWLQSALDMDDADEDVEG